LGSGLLADVDFGEASLTLLLDVSIPQRLFLDGIFSASSSRDLFVPKEVEEDE
jgi:hypothetical protein